MTSQAAAPVGGTCAGLGGSSAASASSTRLSFGTPECIMHSVQRVRQTKNERQRQDTCAHENLDTDFAHAAEHAASHSISGNRHTVSLRH